MATNLRDMLARVKRTVMRQVRVEHDVDDIVQDAWLRLVRYERSGQVVLEPEAFLVRAALNLSLDGYRTRKARGEEPLPDEERLVDARSDVEATLYAREKTRRLDEGMERLLPITRKILMAHRYEGKSYDEIAREYDVSVSAVEKHIAKAMLELTIWMEGW